MKNIKVGDTYCFTSPTDTYHTQGYDYIVLNVAKEFITITCDDKEDERYGCSYQIFLDNFEKVEVVSTLLQLSRSLFDSI